MLELCLTTSLFCTGIYYSFNGKDMIFNSAANILNRDLPEFLRKPIFECLPCMASFWILVFWALSGREISLWILPAIFITSGMNVIISALIKPLFDELA
jgi:hypothetical protein